MELTRPELTRFTARLVDTAQERRFTAYHVRAGRRSALAALVIILIMNAVMFGYRLAGGEPTGGRMVGQLIGTLAGIGVVVWLWRARRPGQLIAALVMGSAVLTALMATIILTGHVRPFQGALMLIGGLAAVYVLMPLDLPSVVTVALGYSAITVPLWIVTDGTDAIYVVLATVLAHLVCIVESRRSQRERRVLFAQRELLLGLSSLDPLTGLVNRRSVDADLARAWQTWRGDRAPLSVLMIDIDHFKRLNDSQGHIAGDHALRLVADVIRSVMPMMPGQVAARYGGEEFCCLLTGVDTGQAARVAERIREGVRGIGIPLTVDGTASAILTVSAGVASARAGMTSPEDLLAAADRQLYRAKDEGRDRVCADTRDDQRFSSAMTLSSRSIDREV